MKFLQIDNDHSVVEAGREELAIMIKCIEHLCDGGGVKHFHTLIGVEIEEALVLLEQLRGAQIPSPCEGA